MKTIEWKCKHPHKGCEATDWKHYKPMPDADAEMFMRDMAKNSKVFDYRIKPEKK